ncbi:MAG: hypothetical protein MUF70_03400 [Myxococcota bacterium]|nr:hypothetical protein [Myxococcota bacterium]
MHGARVRLLVAREDPQQRALAGAVRADEADAVARADFEIHVCKEHPTGNSAGDGLGAHQHARNVATGLQGDAGGCRYPQVDRRAARERRPMQGDGIFLLGERGLHLLFEPDTIEAALDQDPGALRDVVVAHRGELEAVLGEVLCLADAATARTLIEALPPELRHVLVHLYFEILEGRMRQRGARIH